MSDLIDSTSDPTTLPAQTAQQAPAPTQTATTQAPTIAPGAPEVAGPAAIANPKADIAALERLERHLFAHRYASVGISCYNGTIDPPAASADAGEALATLQEEDHELLCSPGTKALLERLEAQDILLSDTQRSQVALLKRDREKLANVPAETMATFTRATNEAFDVWKRAKAASDWDAFAPYLDRNVELMREIAHCRNAAADPYDLWLDEHEPGCDRIFYDVFFTQVKGTVVPLLADVVKSRRQLSRRALEGHFDEGRQWELARDLIELEGLDMNALFVTTAEHPFSDALTTNYAIIAGHVYPEDVLSNVFSILHEGGHALYEQGVNPAYNYTSLKGGTSMGMHEAQSRFFENYVGRSKEFAPVLLATLARRFPGQFSRVNVRQLYQACNRAVPGPLRTEADELTYPLHVLVRYEIEQLLMSGEATAADVPGLWADKYQSYLGVKVANAAEGPLQDVHWSQGAIGYFPTYALGSAYGAQFRHAMIAEGMDLSGLLAAGDLAPIRSWLGRKVWWHGRAKQPAEIVLEATGEEFTPTYYTDYLQEKFTELYAL